MIPYLEEIARRQLDIESEEFLQLVAVAQSFPGPMGINLGVILGYRMGGFPGAAASLAGIALPSLLWAGGLFWFLHLMRDSSGINELFSALKAAMVGIILGMAVQLAYRSSRGYVWVLMAIASCLLFYLFQLHPIWLLAGAGLVGWLYFGRTESGS